VLLPRSLRPHLPRPIRPHLPRPIRPQLPRSLRPQLPPIFRPLVRPFLRQLLLPLFQHANHRDNQHRSQVHHLRNRPVNLPHSLHVSPLLFLLAIPLPHPHAPLVFLLPSPAQTPPLLRVSLHHSLRISRQRSHLAIQHHSRHQTPPLQQINQHRTHQNNQVVNRQYHLARSHRSFPRLNLRGPLHPYHHACLHPNQPIIQPNYLLPLPCFLKMCKYGT